MATKPCMGRSQGSLGSTERVISSSSGLSPVVPNIHKIALSPRESGWKGSGYSSVSSAWSPRANGTSKGSRLPLRTASFGFMSAYNSTRRPPYAAGVR